MSTPEVSPEAREQLAPNGVLRAAINFGNPILAIRDSSSGAPTGVSVDLATQLAALIDVQIRFVLYDAAGEVVTGCERDEWDVAFVARDPVRGKGIEQTRPYILIEGAYLVPHRSLIQSNADIDVAGTRVVVGKGSAYDLFLTRTIQHATILRAPTSPEVVGTMLKEQCEVAAGVRQQLEADAKRLAGLRMLPGRFMVIEQAMGTPKGRTAAANLLQEFVAYALKNGLVDATVATHRITGVTVATLDTPA
ncbi:ABC transporter substrate-binding protein [Paraburkholderia flagellata]|uniref:ABC transporter substrate-binding protein n=1 Tax=Paraburkholderia flagellata TaxID=2883241 RepID=UPI001F1D44BB|nr:ABC transporter substrate-binding protein [Paraburkholderia flagellata]